MVAWRAQHTAHMSHRYEAKLTPTTRPRGQNYLRENRGSCQDADRCVRLCIFVLCCIVLYAFYMISDDPKVQEVSRWAAQHLSSQ